MGNRWEQLEQGVVKQKTAWAIKKQSNGVLVIDVRVEVTGLCMVTRTITVTIEPQATGTGAELVHMRGRTRIAMQVW